MKIEDLTIKDIHQGLIKKDFSATELSKAYLERIKSEDGKINAFLSIAEESAFATAKEIDDLISRGKEISLLSGVPAAIKDNILIKGLKCTASSKILENYQAPFDATCIKKLKEKKTVFLGKTNLDEFAMGSSTENSAFKITRNPNDLERVPGGSSGGSAAAVAAGECCFGLGSDTGGSIRQPASFCGVVGLKPTYGTVSRFGLIAFASSLDQIGPIAKNVEDVQIVFETIRGEDKNDSTSVSQSEIKKQINEENQNSGLEVKNLRIGVPREYLLNEGIDKDVKEEIEKTIKKVEREGAKIKEISLPHTKYSLACYYIISTSEVSSNLARYDGIRYGKPGHGESKLKKARKEDYGENSGTLIDFYLKRRGEGFGREVKRRIMLGTFALSSGYYEAYYLKAQKIRTKILEDFKKAFEDVNVIFTPVSPTTAFKIGEKIKDPLKMYLSDIFTVPVSLAGLPALSLPCSHVNNLPVGLQIIGNAFQESEIFRVGRFVEKIIVENN